MTNQTVINIIVALVGMVLVYLLVGLFVGRISDKALSPATNGKLRAEKIRITVENAHLTKQLRLALGVLNTIHKLCPCEKPTCPSRIAYEGLRLLAIHEKENEE